MKIKIPYSLSDRLLSSLMKAGDRVWRDTEKQCAAWGITANQYNVLRILNGAGEPLSQVEISRRLLSSRANVTKLIDSLEKKGLVRRVSCKDRRVNLIELTETGFEFIAGTLEEATQYVDEEFQIFHKKDQKMLLELLDRFL